MEKLPACPICKRVLTEDSGLARHRPFCSKRCAEVDLSRWLHGVYAIPAVETDEDEDEAGEGANGDGGVDPPIRH